MFIDQAAERESKRIQEQREQEEDNLAEMYNLLSSDMLTENKNSANSSFGINRKITANYRGMTDEEHDEILRSQKFQQIELNVSYVCQNYGLVEWKKLLFNDRLSFHC